MGKQDEELLFTVMSASLFENKEIKTVLTGSILPDARVASSASMRMAGTCDLRFRGGGYLSLNCPVI